MKRNLLFASLAVAGMAVAATAIPVQNVRVKKPDFSKAPKVEKISVQTPQKMRRTATGNAPFTADFSIEGVDNSLKPLYTYHFDDGYQGWTVDPTAYVDWSTKQIAAPGNEKSFSNIDPTDKKSLFVEGDYRIYNRAKSGAVSPEISIPDNGVLSMYVGFSQNYDNYCRLELSLSGDNFEEENIVLWNSGNETGAKTWWWHPVTVKLDEYAGRTVRFKLLYTYGSDDEIFKTGGYMGDFAIDNFQISGRQAIEHIDVMTGEEIHLVDITEGNITSWQWDMPGATPSTSTERNPVIYYTADGTYSVSLTVSDDAGNSDTKTIDGFVTVTGTAPVATIIPPATFRLTDNRLPLVAPLAPVTFRDGSSGFPTIHSWAITGVDEDASKLYTTKEADPEVSFAYLHNQKATLVAQNDHGSSSDEIDFTVEYSGTISNLRPNEGATTFDMEDWGVFPGSNTQKITKYAERFSKPSRPVMITGAYVFFNNNQAADITDQITSVGVHLCKSENGLPGKALDDFWWSVYELDVPSSSGELLGTAFPFTYKPMVDDEFFITVDGIPAFHDPSQPDDGTTCVSFLMAPFREEGNTALFYKDDKWIEANEYFGKHTSFYIYPMVYHSVMAPLSNNTGELLVGKNAGTEEFQIFSYLGREDNPEIDCDWLRVVSAPGEYTVDTLKIAFDALPAGMTERIGHITLTDGASTLTLTVRQNPTTEVTAIAQGGLTLIRNGERLTVSGIDTGEYLTVYSLGGALMLDTKPAGNQDTYDISGWPPGVYVLVNGKNSYKFIK